MQLVASATEASGLASPSPAVIYVGPKGPTSYSATAVRLYHLRDVMFCGYALAAPGAIGIALLFRFSAMISFFTSLSVLVCRARINLCVRIEFGPCEP